RFYVIKSTGELDIYSSMKWGIWTSTDLGNKRLDKGFRSHYGLGPVLLLIMPSGKFCGVAEMTSTVDFTAKAGVWSEKRWRGYFDVKWLYIKDIPMSQLRNIQVANNEGKNISISRDTQEL
ncbi:YTH domain-containing protein, partial [Trichophaea hybrida]